MPILRRENGTLGGRANAVKFLVKAQWLTQEANREGINHTILDKVVAERIAGQPPPREHTSPADQAFQMRLDVISEALQQRHRRVRAQPSDRAIGRYYRTHRPQFKSAPVRRTLMIITRTRAAALNARSSLRDGHSWAATAKRFSLDVSASSGGQFSIAANGAQSPRLRHAAFAAPLGRMIGPIRAMPAAGPSPQYFLFKVVDRIPAKQQPLPKVLPQIRQLLSEKSAQRALAAYERSFLRRWRQRTLCAPGYVIPLCRNVESR